MALPASLTREVSVAVGKINPFKLFMRSMVACCLAGLKIEVVPFPRSFTHAQNVLSEDGQTRGHNAIGKRVSAGCLLFSEKSIECYAL